MSAQRDKNKHCQLFAKVRLLCVQRKAIDSATNEGIMDSPCRGFYTLSLLHNETVSGLVYLLSVCWIFDKP
jgi:hypothetical protein